jgi:OOP family OmpA-OmpF porin
MVCNEGKVQFNKEEYKMKKFMVVAGFMAITLAGSTMSFGIELSSQAAGTLQGSMECPYVSDVKGDKVTYSDAATAYSPTEWDTILRAYGLTLNQSKAGSLPNGYATIKDGKADFVGAPTAFTPNEYHAIYVAYGLQLDTDCIKGTIGKFHYASQVASDGKVTLGDAPTAFYGPEYAEILFCYNLPAKAVKVEKAAETNRPAWVIASDYLFDFDKSVIKKKYYSELDEVAEMIKKDPKLKIEAQGHTDSIGSDKYNMGLSMRRANAVRNYLIKKGGIAADRLTAVGFGESKPVAPNTTKEGRAQNRRVELQRLN